MILGVLPFLAAQASALAAPVPRLECAIRMRAWCIAGLDGTIQLSDDGRQRRWSVVDRLYMTDGPLIILERKTCDAVGRANPRMVGEHLAASSTGNYVVIRYSLSESDECWLEFQLPVGPRGQNPAYRRFMLYGILVNDRQIGLAID